MFDDVENGVALLLAQQGVHAPESVEADVDDAARMRRRSPQRSDERGALEDLRRSAGDRGRPLDEDRRVADR